MPKRKIVKSVKFHLLPITASKHERLEQISENFRDIYNAAAARLPSLQDTSKFKSRNALNRLRIELHDITYVKSQIAQEAIEYARTNYEAMTTRKESIRATIKGIEQGLADLDDTPERKRTRTRMERKLRRNRRALRTKYPTLRRHIIRIHNQSWQFDVQKDRIYVVVPGERVGKQYKKIWLPMKESEHYRYLVNTTPKWGVGQLDLETGTFITSMTTTIDVADYTPNTFIGIDTSGENLTTLVAVKDGKVLQVKMWSGHEIDHVRARFLNYRRRMQKADRLDLVKKSRGREQRWMHYTNHVTSRRIAEIAVKHKNPFVAFEELRTPTEGLRWNSYQLMQMADYKLAAHGIRRITLYASRKNRSDTTCSECGHNERNNRNGATFRCVKCGYSVHTGVNTAKNLAKRGEEVLIKAAEKKKASS
ncbi:MAG: transposase [Chloroflexota bacterium]|nr:transposase [Chloroflexota bacterium]